MKTIRYFLVLLFTVISISAFSAPKKPAWVKQRPTDGSYYIGIAFADKRGNVTDYMQDARMRALSAMASEIKISISSNSVLQQVENNTDIYQRYESKINSSVIQTLEGYEVETWEDKKEYWVMMRLSKVKYQMRQQMKLDQAKMAASVLIDEAEKMIVSYQPYTALDLYFKAALSIKDHLEADLTHRSATGMRDIGMEILNGINNTLQKIEVLPVQKVMTIGRAGVANITPSARVMFAGAEESRPVAGVPVRYSFVSGSGSIKESSISDLEGLVSTSVTKLSSGIKRHEIRMEVDMEQLHKSFGQNEDLWQIFRGKTAAPQCVVVVELEKVASTIDMKEVVFEGRRTCETLQREVRAILAQNFFNFTTKPENASYSVDIYPGISKSEIKSGNGYKVFIVYLEMGITITDTNTGYEVFSHHISGIRGFQPGSFEHAITAACNSMYQKFLDEVIPAMEQLDL